METARLILRRPTLTDVADLFTFLGDADAMRYTHVDASLRACRRRVAVHEWRRRRDGYAPWTITTKPDGRIPNGQIPNGQIPNGQIPNGQIPNGQIIGWGGLYDDPFAPGWGVEVGYFLHPTYWGHGYASELTEACTRVADDLGLPVVSAFAHPDNLGSRRVLEKAGFEVARWVPDMQRLLFRRLRPGCRATP